MSFSAKNRNDKKYRKEPVEINLPGLNGDTLKLKDLRGNIVIVDIWSSNCYGCMKNHRELAKLYKIQQSRKAACAKNFEIFSISIDEDKNIWKENNRLKKSEWPYQVNGPQFLQSELADKIALERAPRLMILNEDGIIVEENVSWRYLQFYLEHMLK